MLGSADLSQTFNRTRLIFVAITMAMALVFVAAALTPTSAHASGCTDSWTNTEGGSWFTGTNWSKGAPPTSEEEACITANGTYTVAMTQTSGTVSVKSLTIGGTSGIQTLVVGSSCSVNAILATTAGISNGAQGAITLTNGDSCGNAVTLSGSLSNAGRVTIEPANGGARTLQGGFTNTGTLAINANTAFNESGALLKNEGTIDVAEAKQLTVSNKAELENGTGGTIAATGEGDVLMSSTAFVEGAGTTSGTKPVIVDDGTLSYTGKGKSLVALHGASALSGNIATGQSLLIESTCGEHAVTTASTGFTSFGIITLTNSETCGNNATLAITSGTLTSSGKIITEPAHGGQRNVQGSITNKGTIMINANTAYDGEKASLINESTLKLAEGTQLTVSNSGSVTNKSGNIVGTGSADLFMGSGTSFTEGGGATNGTKPVVVDDGTLTYTGGGASAIALHGSSTLAGSLVAGQALTIESTCGEHAFATAAEGFTNAGTITLTNSETCGNDATLTVSKGTLTNTGKLVTEPAVGGTRTLQGSITNKGTITINANTAYNGEKASLLNESTVSLAEGTQLSVSNSGAVTNNTGGKIAGVGGADLFMGSGTSFTEGAGTTSGTKPVVIDDGTLTYTGGGASAIALHGSSTLAGSLIAGQALTIESTCGEHAVVTAAEGFTNGGTITLTNSEACGNNATLVIAKGTLTNTGRLVTEPAIGGTRTLQGNLTNATTGTLAIKASTSYNAAAATLINEGQINISEGKLLSVSGGGPVTNAAGGIIFAATGAAFSQVGGTFTEGAGKVSGEPVILDDATLIYGGTATEHGSGKIALRGTSTLTGPIRSPEQLAIQSTCGEHATITATASFFNAGTIELTNGDGCGNNAVLNMKGGTLTNNGALVVANPHGGTRRIEGNLINNRSVTVDAGETLQVTGTYKQGSAGSFTTQIAGTSSIGTLSVTGAATIAGTLTVKQVSFKATLGQKFAILSSAALTGTFATETGDEINFTTGLYYQPSYSATGVTLTVAQATLVISTTKGLPGSKVTLSGSGYLPGDTITPTFKDKSGVLTTYPTVTTNGSGEFSTEITVPEAAAVGVGSIEVKSALTGVHVTRPFRVT